jgi:hypothetical protein
LLILVDVDSRVGAETTGAETTGAETVAGTEAQMAGKTTTVNNGPVIIHYFVVVIGAATFANPNPG